MNYFLLLFALISNAISIAQEYKPIKSLKELCLCTIAQQHIQNSNYIDSGPQLPQELTHEIIQNYNYSPADQWHIPHVNQAGKIIAFNMLYCFVQNSTKLQRIDLLGMELVEIQDQTKTHAISDNGRYLLYKIPGITTLYDYKLQDKIALLPSDHAWISNNQYILCLQNDLISIWKIDAETSIITHKQSFAHIKTCHTFPWQPQILMVTQINNAYTYSLYDCTRDLTLTSWQTNEPLNVCIAHPQKNIIAATHRHEKHKLFIYNLLHMHNSRYLEHPAPVITACFIPKTNNIITTTEQPDNTLRLWDSDKNTCAALHSVDAKPTIESLWWLPIGLYAQDKKGDCWYWHQKRIKELLNLPLIGLSNLR